MKRRTAIQKVSITFGIVTILALAASQAIGAGATITGVVKLKGNPPKPKSLTITKDEDVCGHGQRLIDEVSVSDDGMLADVVVFIDGKMEGVDSPPAPEGGYKLIQRGCRFVPFVSFVPKHEKLTIINDDSVSHNIHAYELIGRARRDLINFAQPGKGHTKVQKISPRRGNIVQLSCDIHDFMSGWIFVPDNPFAALVTQGKFTIEGIPAGKHTVKAYHPIFGFIEQEVELKEGNTVNLNFIFEAEE